MAADERGKMRAEHRRYSPAEAAAKFVSDGAFRRRRLLELASVLMWRTLTAEQISTFVGVPALARHAEDLTIAFIADVFAEGHVKTGLLGRTPERAVRLYKPVVGRAANELLHNVTVFDQLRIGIDDVHRWEAGPQATRHNVLAAELALRIAEFCRIAGVVGESRANAADLVTDKSLFRPRELRPTADLVITREDGLRIAVELTAHANQHFARKVEVWMSVLDRLAVDAHDNLYVLFVEASPLESSDRTARRVQKLIIETLDKSSTLRRRSEVAGRIGFVRWQDWFPRRHHAHRALAGLSCQSLERQGLRAGWRSTALLDITQVPFVDAGNPAHAIALDQLSMYWGTPHWLRDEQIGEIAAYESAKTTVERVQARSIRD